MSKRLLVFLLFGIMSASAFAQGVQVVSVNPANGAVDVDQDSIEIVFNIPINFNTMDVENNNFELFIAPTDSIEITNFELRDGGTRLVMTTNLSDNTDFLMVLTEVSGADGSSLETPFISQFTTSATAGQFVVEGMLTGDEMEMLQAQQNEGASGLIAFLTLEPFQIQIDIGDDDGDGGGNPPPNNVNDEEDEDELNPLYAALVDPMTGAYSISGVREGEYHSTALDIATTDNEEQGGFPLLYIHDPNMDLIADAIQIDAGTTTNDTLKNVDLARVSFDPFTLQEAITRAGNIITGLENNPSLIAGVTEIELVEFDFDMGAGMNIQLSELANDDDPPFEIVPDGRNIIWQLFFYDSVRDSALPLIVTPVGTVTGDFVGQDEAELPVPFNTLDPLPMTFIDSDSAMKIANMNGGMDFLDAPGNFDIQGFTMEAFHGYFDFSPNPTETAPVMWRIEYERDDFGFGIPGAQNEGSFGHREDSLVIYLDVVTGSVLFKAGNLLDDGPPFSVVSSTPANGDAGVATNSEVTLNFDSPLRLDPEQEDFEDQGFVGYIFPNELEPDSVKLDSLGKTLRIFANHPTDTDFTWILARAKSTSGGDLSAPYVLNYTTAATAGSNTISGTVSEGVLKSQVALSGSVVALFNENPFLNDEDDDGGDNEGGPDLDIASATLVSAGDGSYTLTNIRDGEYFPFVIDFSQTTLDEEPSRIGIYDPNDDGIPDNITVSGGNLMSIDLDFVDLVGITARGGLQAAIDSATALDASLDLFFVASDEITLLDLLEDDDDMPAPPPPVANANEEEPEDPTAMAESWEYVFYSSSNQFGYVVEVGQFGIISADTLRQEDMEDLEFPDGTGFADISSLPAMFIDSDSALTVAQANGGAAFLGEDVPVSLIEMEFILSNATFFIPAELNVPANTFFWEVIYLTAFQDPITNNFLEEEFIVYVNAADGSFLGSDLLRNDPFTVKQGFDSANGLATSIAADNELIFINGFSILDRNPDLDMPPPPALRKQFNTDLPGGDALDGLFFFADYRFFSVANDDQTAIGVNSFAEANVIPNANTFFLPGDGSVQLSELAPIDPDMIIDSDSAMAVAEMEGGADFRNSTHFGLDLVRLDVSAQAGNFFYNFPPGSGLPNNTIAWQVFYNRETVNPGTGVREFENATFLINAFTGALIDENVQVSTDDGPEVPTETELLQNYPNPFNPSTVIPFSINKPQNVQVVIFNLLGQRVATLTNQLFQAGTHSLTWDASRFSSGVYIYQLRTADVIQTRKLTLIK